MATLGIHLGSQVSELESLDGEVAALWPRLDAGPYAYVWLDALAVRTAVPIDNTCHRSLQP